MRFNLLIPLMLLLVTLSGCTIKLNTVYIKPDMPILPKTPKTDKITIETDNDGYIKPQYHLLIFNYINMLKWEASTSRYTIEKYNEFAEKNNAKNVVKEKNWWEFWR